MLCLNVPEREGDGDGERQRERLDRVPTRPEPACGCGAARWEGRRVLLHPKKKVETVKDIVALTQCFHEVCMTVG